MTTAEIEAYLKTPGKISFNPAILDEIENLRQEAISRQEEESANLCWCYKEIFITQERFVRIFNQLKSKKYEEAWHLLERTEIHIGNLIENFDIKEDDDPYQIAFITKTVKQFVRLFPYKVFLSREEIIKEEKCSICGEKVTLRNSCGHKVGKLYMGELCTRQVTDFEFLGAVFVHDPLDMYAVVKIVEPDVKFNYGVLDRTMEHLKSPYDKWYVDILPVLKPEFGRQIGPNELCPCGSGRKFKKCCKGTSRIYAEHYRITCLEPGVVDVPFMWL